MTDPAPIPPIRNRFVGRVQELEELRGLVCSGPRLITLLGTAGLGKSRLAREAATEAATGELEGRAWLCDMADATSAADAARVLLATLPDTPPDPGGSDEVASVLGAIDAEGASLIVLDNFDRLCGCADETIRRWLDATNAVRFLVTSRQRLALTGEICRELQPLDPDDAAALFLERAAQRQPLGPVSAERGHTVRAIVDALECNPLAIELAAARTAVLSLSEVDERLREGSSFLAGGSRDRPPRHQSLRRAIEWSWEQLGDADRSVSSHLSVFRGDFSAADAEAVLARSDDADVLDLLQALVDRSLVSVVAHSDDRVRYRLYGPVRDFVTDQLAESGEREELELRHAVYFTEQAEKWASKYKTKEGSYALGQLRAMFDNVLAAHERTRESHPELAARAVLALTWNLRSRGLQRPSDSLLDAAVECAARADDAALYARAKWTRAMLRIYAGDRVGARGDFATACELAHAAGDLELEGGARAGLCAVALLVDDQLEEAEEQARAARDVYEQAGNHVGAANATANLALIALERGDTDAARALVDRAITAFDSAGLGHLQAFPTLLSGAVNQELGHLERAAHLYLEGRQLARDLHRDRGLEVDALTHLGSVRLEQERPGDAAQAFDEAIEICRATASTDLLAPPLAMRAAASALLGEHQRAEDSLRESQAFLGSYRGRGAREIYWACAAIAALHAGRKAPAQRADRDASASSAVPVAQMARAVLRVLAGLHSPPGDRQQKIVRIDPAARWFAVQDAAEVSLGRRMVLRRILVALAEHRRDHPGVPMTRQELRERAWPGEKMDEHAATNRLHVSISKLRKLGLDSVLLTRNDGYLLDAEFTLELDEIDA